MCGRSAPTVNVAHARARALACLALVASLLSLGCWNSEHCGAPRCVGNALETCVDASYGPDTTSYVCAGTCVVDPNTHEPFCALDDTPDASCQGEARRRCDGTTVVSCRGGYETERLDCAANGTSLGLKRAQDEAVTCVDSPFAFEPECSIAWAADARCDATSEVSFFCDGDVRVGCYGRYPVRKQACSAPEDCDQACRR